MTEQQENRAFTKMLKEFPKAFGRVSFRERLMLRTAFTYVVEEVIADLKANFDYVLEGKNLEIKQLKMTDEYIIKTLESKVEKLQEDLRRKRISIKNKKAEINELKLELTVEKDQHQEEINLHLHAEEYIKSLEQQIEKMKRHCNCKHRDGEGYCEVKRTYLMDLSYDGCDKWELED